MEIKLTKNSTRLAASLPGVMDIVFYKDEKGRLYRLRYVDNVMPPVSISESLHRMMCVAKYAPEIIQGKIIWEHSEDVHVKMGDDIYVIQKNAEDFKFWDVTGKYAESNTEDKSS